MSIYVRLTFYIWNGMEELLLEPSGSLLPAAQRWPSYLHWDHICLLCKIKAVLSTKKATKLGVAETQQLHWKDVRNASCAVSSVSWTNLSHFLIRVRRGVPRTFYISGSFLIHKLIFWPDRKSFKILLFTWGLENAFIWLK